MRRLEPLGTPRPETNRLESDFFNLYNEDAITLESAFTRALYGLM